MSNGVRSPFGKMLREERLKLGLSQSALADQIAARAARDPDVAELGLISEKTISNLEAATSAPSRFVRPRPHTVRILLAALDIAPGSTTETEFLDAAEATRTRAAARLAKDAPADSELFVLNGRQDHYDQLHSAWERARAGQPQIVFLAGDAGAGKTRMALKFCEDIRQRHHDVMVGWGECTSGATSVEPYLPFRQALNYIVDPARRQHGPVADWNGGAIESLTVSSLKLANVLIDESALRNRFADQDLSLQAELERMLDTRSATDTLGRFDALVQLLASWSASWPIVLILEDLHWSGEQTCSLLLHLQRQLAHKTNAPLLIIGTYRQSDLALPGPEARHPLRAVLNEIGRQVNNPVIDLGTTIGLDAGRAFIDGLVDNIGIHPDSRIALSNLLFDRTEGHPLFAIELIRWLRESNALTQSGDKSWAFNQDNLDHTVPGKVRSVIAERVDRLPAHVRSVLEIGAIQGPTINVDILARMSEHSDDELTDILDDQLVTQHRLLRPARVLTIENQRFYLYSFRHAVFQEYVYESLSPRRRDKLHRETAISALELFGTKHRVGSGEIAFHFARAHMPREAAIHAYQTAFIALRSLDYDLASIWIDRAEDYATQANDHHQLWQARSARVAVMRGTGALEEALLLANDVIEEARAYGYRLLEAECHDLTAHIFFDRSRLTEAVGHLDHAIRIYRELDKHDLASGSESMLSHSWYRLGAYDEARLHAQRAWQNAQRAGNDPFAAEALLAAANCEIDLGMYDVAIRTYERARHIYARSGEIRGEILTALNTGLCHVQLGDAKEATTILSDVKQVIEKLRAPRLHAVGDLYLGYALELAGDLDEAHDLYLASLEIRRGIGLIADSCDNLAGLLRIAIARNNTDDIRMYVDELQDWLGSNSPDGIEEPIRVYLSMMEAYDALGDTHAAEHILETGHVLLTERASHISDEEAQQSYLSNVPANRRLRELHARQSATRPFRGSSPS